MNTICDYRDRFLSVNSLEMKYKILLEWSQITGMWSNLSDEERTRYRDETATASHIADQVLPPTLQEQPQET